MRSTLLLLALVGAVLWLWRDSLRARETATRICKAACERDGVQLLDGTVALIRVRPTWHRGRPLLRRLYGFEFSRAGVERLDGVVGMLGPHLEQLVMAGEASDTPQANVFDIRGPG